MNLGERIQKDLIQSMKQRDAERTSVLRMIKAALQNREIDKRAPLTEPETQQVLKTLLKQRNEAIEQYDACAHRKSVCTDLVHVFRLDALALEEAVHVGYQEFHRHGVGLRLQELAEPGLEGICRSLRHRPHGNIPAITSGRNKNIIIKNLYARVRVIPSLCASVLLLAWPMGAAAIEAEVEIPAGRSGVAAIGRGTARALEGIARHVRLLGAGEPFTAAKKAVFDRVGAHYIPIYISEDTGPIGMPCANPVEPNEQHQLADNLALIHSELSKPENVLVASYVVSGSTVCGQVMFNAPDARIFVLLSLTRPQLP